MLINGVTVLLNYRLVFHRQFDNQYFGLLCAPSVICWPQPSPLGFGDIVWPAIGVSFRLNDSDRSLVLRKTFVCHLLRKPAPLSVTQRTVCLFSFHLSCAALENLFEVSSYRLWKTLLKVIFDLLLRELKLKQESLIRNRACVPFNARKAIITAILLPLLYYDNVVLYECLRLHFTSLGHCLSWCFEVYNWL